MERKTLWIALAIFALAMTLRSTFLAVTPLIPVIRDAYHLSASEIGLLTTIPLAVFGIFSSFVGAWGARIGTGKILFISLLIMMTGTIVRYVGGQWGLFFGTFLLALGIVAGNVLIPALVSAFFPNKVPVMTSSYTSLMQVTTGIALATIVPVAMTWGWENAVLLWSIPVYVAAILWFPLRNLRIEGGPGIKGRKPTIKSVFTHSLAWYVSLFMGIQSLLFYSISTWLPVILIDRGISPVSVGIYLSLFQVTSLLTTFSAPLFLKLVKDQSGISVFFCMMLAVGLGLIYVSESTFMVTLSVLLIGIAAGGVFAIAMMFFIMRTSTPTEAAVLSGVGQAIGYVLAAAAPVFLGYLHDVTMGWGMPIAFMIGACFIFAYMGFQSGKERKIPVIYEDEV